MSKRILLVEDDTNTRIVLRQVLEAEGFHVDACEDGLRALDCLHARPYDELLTDLVMPASNGLELTHAARALQPAIRCFVMTGAVRPRDGDEHLAAWLDKPVDLDALLALLLT